MRQLDRRLPRAARAGLRVDVREEEVAVQVTRALAVMGRRVSGAAVQVWAPMQVDWGLPRAARAVLRVDMREEEQGVQVTRMLVVCRVLGRWVLEAAVQVLAPMQILALVRMWLVSPRALGVVLGVLGLAVVLAEAGRRTTAAMQLMSLFGGMFCRLLCGTGAPKGAIFGTRMPCQARSLSMRLMCREFDVRSRHLTGSLGWRCGHSWTLCFCRVRTRVLMVEVWCGSGGAGSFEACSIFGSRRVHRF